MVQDIGNTPLKLAPGDERRSHTPHAMLLPLAAQGFGQGGANNDRGGNQGENEGQEKFCQGAGIAGP